MTGRFVIALLLSAHVAGGEVIRIEMREPQQVLVRRQVQTNPMTHAIDLVHQACAEEIANTCEGPAFAPPEAEDPLEAFFGVGFGHDGDARRRTRIDVDRSHDPFAAMMRSSMASDPFLRLAMTPPSSSAAEAMSPFGSSTLLDELFGGDVGRIDRIMDDMMDSALKFGMMASSGGGGAIPMQKTIVRVASEDNPAQVETSETVDEQQHQQEEAEDPAAVEDANPADIAEAALEKMVNSFLGHVVSASASSPTQLSKTTEPSGDSVEDNGAEEDGDDHPQAPRASDGDIQREVLSHDDVDTDADSIETSHRVNGLDPIAMARRIVQRGRAILQEEQEDKIEMEDEDDHELRRRRRLTAIDEDDISAEPAVRRRLARRLTEVIPLVGMPTGVTVIPLQDGGLRFLLREPEPFPSRPAPVQHVGPTPRLMLGCAVQSCLWDMFDGHDAAMSSQCATSLSNVRTTYAQLLQEEERQEREMVATLLNNFGIGNEGTTGVSLDANSNVLTAVTPVMFWLWLTFFVVSIYACLNAGGDDDGDDEEDDEMANPEDYVILRDSADLKAGHAQVPPSERSRALSSAGGVYTGIPVQVV